MAGSYRDLIAWQKVDGPGEGNLLRHARPSREKSVTV